jgi:hypothetical protein
MFSASGAASAAGSFSVLVEGALASAFLAKMPTNMASTAASWHSRRTAMRMTNVRMAETRSCFFAASAVSVTICPMHLPSSAVHSLGRLTWRKYS